MIHGPGVGPARDDATLVPHPVLCVPSPLVRWRTPGAPLVAGPGGRVYLDTREISSRDAYRLLISSVVPRPIGWVSSVSIDDVGNLAPFSFFMAATGNPPTVVLSTSFRDGGPKDTLQNVKDV